MKEKTSKHIPSWIVSILFFIAAVGTLLSGNVLTAIFYILGGVIINPVVRGKLRVKTWLSVVLAVLFLVLGGVCATPAAESTSPEGVTNETGTNETGKEDSASDETEEVEPSENDSTLPESDSTLPENTTTEDTVSYEITYQNYTLYTDMDNDVRDYVLVQIQNTGTKDLYLGNASFDFEDADGHLVAVDSGLISADPSIIAPGEYGYFYSNMGVLSGDDISENGEYVLIPNLTIEESKNEIIRYEISDTSISVGSFAPIDVIGRITNNTSEDASLVWVAVVFFDENDIPLGIAGTNVTDLAAGNSQSFEVSTIYLSDLDISVDDVARYEVYACKTQYQF